jgi:methionyl-tRNA formyltransferase
MLPEIVWNMPPMGTINVHGSLLPQYRGAAPINWAVINGEKETGVTTFKLKHDIDTGDILLQESFTIGEDETAGDVHDRMKEIGAQLLVKTVKGLSDQSIQEMPQSKIKSLKSDILHHAPKINTETCIIHWDRSVETVHNHIRGLSPFPGAFTIINEKILKVFRSKKEITYPKSTEGDYETDGKTFLKFVCTDGYLHLLEVQLEGKKKMTIADFLKGYRFNGN